MKQKAFAVTIVRTAAKTCQWVQLLTLALCRTLTTLTTVISAETSTGLPEQLAIYSYDCLGHGHESSMVPFASHY
jgi:hypothetical protein